MQEFLSIQDIGRLKKNNLTMREYLSKMKSLSDTLASVGHSLSQEDQVSNITNGLGAEYESVIVSVTSRVEPFTVSEVTALLLAHEKRIESYYLNPDGSTPSANLAFHNGQKKQNIAGSQNFKLNQYTHNQQFQGNRGKGRGRGRGHGNSGRGWSNNKPQCQLCGKFGHIVQKCYHRFDPFYTGFPSESNSNGSSGGSFGNFGGNSGGSSGNSGSQGFYPSANVAAQDSMNDNNTWFPDSDATNHVTSAFSNLNIGSTYHGNSKLQMGNGAVPTVENPTSHAHPSQNESPTSSPTHGTSHIHTQEKVEAKQVSVQHVPALDQTTDILTKALSLSHFERLNGKLKVASRATVGLRGSIEAIGQSTSQKNDMEDE
ncbi:hypothetical protein EZV62_014166 [Acer yangbiense]|uniref:CCHC-type domain-containing protein n=1 Tax=Acer yangbiense TaxID=1000413 RepID=A0A5C7HRB2_9ROSI|nr:hypothetical protein EZV62_014166 [Acer yangbiense]